MCEKVREICYIYIYLVFIFVIFMLYIYDIHGLVWFFCLMAYQPW